MQNWEDNERYVVAVKKEGIIVGDYATKNILSL